jgi:hypothetical protein
MAEVVDPATKPADAPTEAAKEEESSLANFGKGYYEAPVISLLSNNGEGWDLGKELFGEDSQWDIGGWVQMSTTTNSDGVFNTKPNGFRPQQNWLYAERKANGENGLDWGFRVDWLYGLDAQNTQAFGNEFGRYDFSDPFTKGEYGFAIPQAYGELAYQDFSVKAGHFFTPLGYEVVPATGNFFFSHAFTMNNSEPFTHTGVLGTYSGIDKLTLYAGYTLGWDSGFDRFRGGSNALAGFTYKPWEWVAATYLMTLGDLGWRGEGYTHSIVVDTTPFDNFKFILLSDLTQVEDNAGIGGDFNTGGIANYMIYQIMEEIGVGTRAEYWQLNGVDYYEVTGGINFKPLPNLIVRPEGRYQWGPGSTASANNPAGLPVNTGIFGIDMIVTF